MAFLINWLNAIGALIIFGLIYNEMLMLTPYMAGFLSLMALIFIALSYLVRVNAMKMVPLSHMQALAGLILVLVVIGAGIYFIIPQIKFFTYTGQYVVAGWFFLLDALILTESLLSFRGTKHPVLEEKLNRLNREEAAK